MSKLFRPEEYCRPMSLEETISLMAKYGDRARLIAGGTDLLVEKPGNVECLIDITHLPLAYIERNDNTQGIDVGALTTIRGIETSTLLEDEGCKVYVALAEAAKKIGYITTRNTATIGGNICNAVPSADLPPVLIALDAKARILGSNGERSVPLEEFFLNVRKTVLKSDELLTEIQIPSHPPLTGTSFFKLGRVHVDIALVNVGTRVTLGSDESCEDVRISLGGVAPTPIRARKAENLLKGKKPGDALVEEVAQTASEEARPISDVRASASYRTTMCRVLVKRALDRAFERARRK